MTLDELYAKIAEKAAKTTSAGAPDASILLDLTGADPRRWLVRFNGGKISISDSDPGPPDLTVTAAAETIIKVATRKTSPMAAFITGKIKVKGDSALAGQLKNIWPD